jgi:hypothetical protein
MKALNLIALCLLISACVTGYNPRYYYSDIVIANLTGATIRNVRVEIGPGGRVLECAEVTKDRICQQRFGKSLYPKAEIRLSWESSDGKPMSAQKNPSVPVTFSPGPSLRVMMDIAPDGSVDFYFKQDTVYVSDREVHA